MARKLIVVSNRIDPFNGNLGDFASSSSSYFEWTRSALHIQLDLLGALPLAAAKHILRNASVIVGGGGLIGSLPLFERGMKNVTKAVPSDSLVLWGAGINSHGDSDVFFPDYLDEFGLVALRDKLNDETPWTPCPSVMLPGIVELRNCTPTCYAAIYNNWQASWTCEEELPVLNNNRRFASASRKRLAIRATLEYLASAQVVLTSAYHGMVWATLLGKKVVVTRQLSNKFKGWPYPPAFLQDGEHWEDAAARASKYPNALKECRANAQNFSDTARDFLEF